MKLSKAVVDYRKRLQISQREFARRCDLSNSYISFIENEYNPRTGKPIVPTLEQYQKIASGMQISVQQLFELLDEDSPVDLHFTSIGDPADVTGGTMSPDYKRLLDTYNALPPSGKDYLQQQARIARVMFSEQPTEYKQEE